MSNMLIILDQPSIQSDVRITSPSATVVALFAGDVADRNFNALNSIKGMCFDMIMVPETLEKGSAVHNKVMSFIDEKKTGKTSVHTYSHFY